MLFTITAVTVLITNVVMLSAFSAVGVGLFLRSRERKKVLESMRGVKR